MIRIIVQSAYAGMAANIGGPVEVSFRTFDVELPKLEEFLRETIQYGHRQVVGAELVTSATGSSANV